MIKYNFHTHSEFCDGKEDIEQYLLSAINKGFKAIGFSPHSPLPFQNPWSISEENLELYLKKSAELKEKYRDKIDIYTGIELDYIPCFSDDFKKILGKGEFDYSIGSVHLVKIENSDKTWFIDGREESFFKGIQEFFEGNAKKAVVAFFEQTIEMIQTQRFDIIGHLDKVKMHNKERAFSTGDNWYKDIIIKTLELIKAHGIIVEFNTRGVYTGKSTEYFPSEEILMQCLKMNIPVMINTDAHMPEQVDAHFDIAVDILRKRGFKKTQTPFFAANL